MTRLLPRTLVGQMILILLGGLVASHLAASWINATDREQALRAVGGYAVAQRIANLARLIDEAPEDWRNRIVAAASDPTLRVSLSARPSTMAAENSDSTAPPIRDYLAEQLPEAMAMSLRIVVAGAPGAPLTSAAHPMHTMGVGNHAMGPWMHGVAGGRGLQADVRLLNGQWLSFAALLPEAGPSASWRFVFAMALMSCIVVLTSIWAVRRVTAPLGIVAQAAVRLGRDVNAPPIAETGSQEMRQAAHAFNEMQGRLRRLLDNRTHMLAALSHDLRTPLTLLRLRIEALREGEERDRMLASIAELNGMIDATLLFARDEAAAEPARQTDLAALLTAIVDDMADAGLPVKMTPAESVVIECRPDSLRRAVTNLLDNAVKYGGSGRVELRASPRAVSIAIDDAGPGIPDAELRRVFEPFYRLEQSRGRETGGAGLGLAIAQSIAQAHDGQVTLANRPAGGLRATITLPR